MCFGDITAVDKLNLLVPKGSIFGFVGPNGSGKTTTMRLLLGLIKADSGNVKLFNSSFKENRGVLLRKVGALIESPAFYPHLTGYENLHVTAHLINASKEDIKECLVKAKIEKDAHRLVREYSKGMRQRLGVALSLLGNPELLILDEPSNGLDPQGIHDINELILDLQRQNGVTVVLSSHILAQVENIATRIGIIDKGKLLFQGNPDDLQSRQQVILVEVENPDAAGELLKKSRWEILEKSRNSLKISSQSPEDTSVISTLLIRNGFELIHIGFQKKLLEEVFINLTGEKRE